MRRLVDAAISDARPSGVVICGVVEILLSSQWAQLDGSRLFIRGEDNLRMPTWAGGLGVDSI